ncbi:MAG: hypothetical protein Aurels2KO_52510 [Aureliella sp.]
MRKLRTWIAVAFLFGLSNVAFACLWDSDTLLMERERFPDAQELIAGHFVRHSTAYYQWRLAARTKKESADRTPSDFDDIAVAYEKLGRHEKAIDTIRAKMDRWPEKGQYKSHANLGTFYIHAGRLEEGLEEIRQAIELNPDAHFGREVYQKLLVEYLLGLPDGPEQLPLSKREDSTNRGFAAFVLDAQGTEPADRAEELRAAAKGILGMMRFGNHNSPVLLEVLGDVLLGENYEEDAKMLAARAYLRASDEVSDPLVVAAYRQKAKQTLEMKVNWNIEDVEADLRAEIKQGEELFRQIADDEQAWAAAGQNLDDRFADKYYASPKLALSHSRYSAPSNYQVAAALATVLIATITISIYAIYRIFFRRKSAAANG